jgi:predicted ATP-binding protein involved in virulence
MKIRQLELKNFRCFDHKTFEFSDQFNVLIGDNGTGKTAILDALAIAAGSFFLGIDNINSRNIADDDIRHIVRIDTPQPTSEKILPVAVSCEGCFEDIKKMSWARELRVADGRTTRIGAKEILFYANQLQERVRVQENDREKIILPVIKYFTTSRLWNVNRDDDKTLLPSSQLQGYDNWLASSSSSVKILTRWFRTLEWGIFQRKRDKTPESISLILDIKRTMSAVTKAIKNCMEDWQNVKYDILLDELVATSLDGRTLPFRMLSDGVRNMIGMVADIALSCVTLNPLLSSEAAQLTPGIVLIDEIDLHLHPKWQRRVIDDLKRTFPKIQFFVTTHSEYIIQSLREGELIDLNSPESIPEAEYENKSIEDIAENVMHVSNPYRSERYQNMMEVAERYYKLLENSSLASSGELETLKLELDRLIEPYSSDVAYHAFLKMKRLAALGD